MAAFRFDFFPEATADANGAASATLFSSPPPSSLPPPHTSSSSTCSASCSSSPAAAAAVRSVSAARLLPDGGVEAARALADAARRRGWCHRVVIDDNAGGGTEVGSSARGRTPLALWVRRVGAAPLSSTSLSAPRPAGSSGADVDVVQVARERDVLTGVYEGGFKVWECAIDVIQYMRSFESPSSGPVAPSQQPQLLGGLSVLEAGCGLGLPSVCALRMGAARVFLQDLNEEVLREGTLATVALNARSEGELRRWFDARRPAARFVAGDWESLVSRATGILTSPHQQDVALPNDAGVDLILTTDTIYARPQIAKLVRLIHGVLSRRASGATATAAAARAGSLRDSCPCAFVAAKRYYFGTDGGTFTFTELLARMPSVKVAGPPGSVTPQRLKLYAETVRQLEDCQSNIRDIVRVYWKDETTDS